MKPTITDFLFWKAHQKRPSWAKAFDDPQAPTIDEVVNRHGAERILQPRHHYVPTRYEMAAQATLNILRITRRLKNGNILKQLDAMAVNPNCAGNPKKRAAYAKKWAARIRRST